MSKTLGTKAGRHRVAVMTALAALAISSTFVLMIPEQSCWASGLEAAQATGRHAPATRISKASFKAIGAQLYTGKRVKPKVKASYGGRALKAGRDYRVRYSRNLKVGTATVKVTGTGKFNGTKALKFQIAKKRHRVKVLVKPARTTCVPVYERRHYYHCSVCGRLGADISTPEEMLAHLAGHWESGEPGEKVASYADMYETVAVGMDVKRTAAVYEWRWVAG